MDGLMFQDAPWWCNCGWHGDARDLKPMHTGSLHCPGCGATGGLESKPGGRVDLFVPRHAPLPLRTEVARIREAADLDVDQLAEAARIARSIIQRVEAGSLGLSLGARRRIATAAGADPDALDAAVFLCGNCERTPCRCPRIMISCPRDGSGCRVTRIQAGAADTILPADLEDDEDDEDLR